MDEEWLVLELLYPAAVGVYTNTNYNCIAWSKDIVP